MMVSVDGITAKERHSFLRLAFFDFGKKESVAFIGSVVGNEKGMIAPAKGRGANEKSESPLKMLGKRRAPAIDCV
jgi:hypothetical protein